MKLPLVYLLPGFLLCGSLVQPSHAQDTPEQNAALEEMPAWLISFSNLPKEKREEYVTRLNQAKQAYHAGKWVDCIAYLAECELIMTGNPNIWNLRASCLMEQKYFEEAEAELNRVLAAMPGDQVALMNQANLFMATGRYTQSLQILNSLRDALPLDADAELHNVLAFRAMLCYLMLGQEKEAKEQMKHVSAMSDTPLYHFGKGACALSRGDRQEASRQIHLAEMIFANNKAYIPYQRSLALSGILNIKPKLQLP